MSTQKQVTVIFLSNHGQEPNVYPTISFHQEVSERNRDVMVLNQFAHFGDELALGPRILVFLNEPPNDAIKEYSRNGDLDFAVRMNFRQQTIEDIFSNIPKVLIPKPRRNVVIRKHHPRARGAD
jgi:hypothetical protein